MITVTQFFGDRECAFALTDPMLTELEAKTDTGIGALYQRVVGMQFRSEDLPQIIRLGLIGGGMNPEQAHRMTETYARNRPFDEILPLALDILDARWIGTAAQTGDLAAALTKESA